MKKFIKKLNRNEDVTIEFVGDSLTQGRDHCHPEEGYVAKFAYMMANKFKHYNVNRYDGIVEGALLPMKGFEGPILVSYKDNQARMDIIKNGIGGNTVLRALNRIDDFTGTLANGKTPDVIFVLFGVNDALKSDPNKYVTAEQFKINYKLLLDEVRKRNPDAFIIMISATTNDQTIEAHCEKAKELADEENIPYIDIHTLWTNHYVAGVEHFGHGDWLANDKDACHPTPKAAYIIAETIFDAFLKIIDSGIAG